MRRAIFTLTSALAASLLAPAASAAPPPSDWQVVSNASDGKFSVEFFVDANSIQRDGAVVQFIERAEFTNHAKGWKQVISQSVVNCQANRARTLRMRVTKVNGTVQVFDQTKTSQWAAIQPESNGAFMRDFVCKRSRGQKDI
jgi:hypothetical protein